MPILGARGAASAKGFGLTAGGPVVIDITSSTTNYNLFTATGSPIVAKKYIVNVASGVTIGGSGSTAFTVGQFPSGTEITINNAGTIVGFGGSAGTSSTGGNGGDAIKADYPNQTVVINNLAGAYIYGGGGGGGKGGTGGTGGQGSTSSTTYQGSSSCTRDTANLSCVCVYGGGAYCTEPQPQGEGGYNCGACYLTTTTYYSGGSGGAGGNGGVGAGYSQSSTSGSAGSSGSAGGTNAGAGGTGGTGGAGGAYGSNGSTGSTGSTGANGNAGSGSAGSAGSSGGTAGRYLVKGAYSVTLNNSGTVAGGLA